MQSWKSWHPRGGGGGRKLAGFCWEGKGAGVARSFPLGRTCPKTLYPPLNSPCASGARSCPSPFKPPKAIVALGNPNWEWDMRLNESYKLWDVWMHARLVSKCTRLPKPLLSAATQQPATALSTITTATAAHRGGGSGALGETEAVIVTGSLASSHPPTNYCDGPGGINRECAQVLFVAEHNGSSASLRTGGPGCSSRPTIWSSIASIGAGLPIGVDITHGFCLEQRCKTRPDPNENVLIRAAKKLLEM